MRKTLLIGACLAATAFASAGPTGLWVMPIADILGHREGFAQLGFGGTEQNVSKGFYYYNGVEVGVLDRVEIGYDNDFLGYTSYNIKVQLFDSPRGLEGTALSVGVMNCCGGYREPFVVGRHDFKDFRLHAGYWNTMGCGRMVIGADFPVFGNGSASIEYMSGPSNATWGSLYEPADFILPGLGFVVAFGVPSNRSEGLQYSAMAMYTFKF